MAHGAPVLALLVAACSGGWRARVAGFELDVTTTDLDLGSTDGLVAAGVTAAGRVCVCHVQPG
jgi:hypothetical protein